MFSFLKIKSYRQSFILLLAVMTSVSVLILLFISALIIDQQKNAFRTEALEASASFENRLIYYDAQTNRLLQKIHRLKPLYDDYVLFTSSVSEADYLAERSEESANGISILDACSFLFDLETEPFSEVVFVSEQSVNRIAPDSSGNITLSFDLDREQTVYPPALLSQKGVSFQRSVWTMEDFGEKCGDIQFAVDPARVFSALPHSTLFTGIRFSSPAGDYCIEGSDPQIPFSVDKDSSVGKFTENGQTFYYVAAPLDRFDCTLLFTTTASVILKSRALSFLLLFAMVTLLFNAAVFTVALRFRQNYLHLNAILDRIEHIGAGDLTCTAPAGGVDVFLLIQNALSKMSEEIDRHIEREYVLKLEQQKAEMAALEHQINPHFLYNTLEIIRSKAFLSGNPEVSDAIFNLGNLYRSIVKKPSVLPFSDEIALLESYLKIMECRFGDKFYYTIDIPEEIRLLDTVKFWMQPLTENFFAHGFSHDEPHNLLLITGEVSEREYTVSFIDNGKQPTAERIEELNRRLHADTDDLPETGAIGMKNVYSRLRHFYGEDLRMTIQNNDADGVTIAVSIPRRV